MNACMHHEAAPASVSRATRWATVRVGLGPRDPLRRRLLALADIGALAAVAASFARLRAGASRRGRSPALRAGLDRGREAVWALRPRPPHASSPDCRRAADHPRVGRHLRRRPGPVPRGRPKLARIDAETATRTLGIALVGRAAPAQLRAARVASHHAARAGRDRRRRRARALDPPEARALLRHPRLRRRRSPARSRPRRSCETATAGRSTSTA